MKVILDEDEFKEYQDSQNEWVTHRNAVKAMDRIRELYDEHKTKACLKEDGYHHEDAEIAKLQCKCYIDALSFSLNCVEEELNIDHHEIMKARAKKANP